MGYTTAPAAHSTTIDPDDVEVISVPSDSASNDTVATDDYASLLVKSVYYSDNMGIVGVRYHPFGMTEVEKYCKER